MSDTHLGSPYVDKKKIVEDCEAAAKADAAIIINGDVFDAINPKDKRFMPSCYDKELLGKDDVGESMVEMGFKIFAPFANRIKVIGVGNHEESWLRRSAEDLVGRLIAKLNAELDKQGCSNRVRHGGISGFYRTIFQFPRPGGRSSSTSHTLMYAHGAGGDSPVTKGMTAFYRKSNEYFFDAITMGHRHHRNFDHNTIMVCSPAGHITHHDRYYIQTASYMYNIVETNQSNPMNYSYAESALHATKPLGGMFLTVIPKRETRVMEKGNTSLYKVQQEVATAV